MTRLKSALASLAPYLLAAIVAAAFLATARPSLAGDSLLAAAATTTAPVLRRPLAKNGQLSAGDIQWVEAETKRLPRDAILEETLLVGMVAQRNLRAGRVLRTRDVAEPVAVGKGDLVSIVYATRFMTLTARGRALSSAPVGGAVRVVNAHSKQTIEATAVAPGLVTARPFGHAQITGRLQ